MTLTHTIDPIELGARIRFPKLFALADDLIERTTDMSSHDLYEDGFPHGTRDGYDRGCRGAACPAGIEHGLSCRRAFSLSSGDYRYSRLVAEGRTPAEIAAALDEHPHHPEPPKPRPVVPDDDTDIDLEEAEPEQEEPAMPTPKTITKKPKDTLGTQLKAAKTPRKSPAGPSQSEVRAWAHANGVEVNARGAVRSDVVEAYRTAHQPVHDASKPPLELKPMEPAVQPPALSEPVEHELAGVQATILASLNREADGEPDLPESTEGWSWPRDTEAMATVATYDPDLVEQLAQLNAHLEHLREERDQANDCLALLLTKWAEEQERARAATLDMEAAKGAARILQEALAQAEEDLTAARRLAEARGATIDRLEALLDRPWWKRGAA